MNVEWRSIEEKPGWYEASHFWVARPYGLVTIAMRIDETGSFMDIHTHRVITDATHWAPVIWPSPPGEEPVGQEERDLELGRLVRRLPEIAGAGVAGTLRYYPSLRAWWVDGSGAPAASGATPEEALRKALGAEEE